MIVYLILALSNCDRFNDVSKSITFSRQSLIVLYHTFRCILKDFVHVEAGTVIPADVVVPPFSIVSGSPARIVGEVPEGCVTLIPNSMVERFQALKHVKT